MIRKEAAGPVVIVALSTEGMKRPALLPQVYLHYDPLTRKQRQKLHKGDRLKRERMDFLLMWPGRA